MARRVIHAVLLGAGLLAPFARAAEPGPRLGEERIEASVAVGRMQLLGLGDYASLGDCARVELALEPAPGLKAGLLLQGSLHDVVHWELQEGDRGVLVPGDLHLAQLGALARWHPRDGLLQPGLRAEAGVAHWRSPGDPDAWQQVIDTNRLDLSTHATGPWASLGAELGVEVMEGGPRIQLALDGGYLRAGGASGPFVSGNVAFVAGF